jgi:hypothetical protein
MKKSINTLKMVTVALGLALTIGCGDDDAKEGPTFLTGLNSSTALNDVILSLAETGDTAEFFTFADGIPIRDGMAASSYSFSSTGNDMATLAIFQEGSPTDIYELTLTSDDGGVYTQSSSVETGTFTITGDLEDIVGSGDSCDLGDESNPGNCAPVSLEGLQIVSSDITVTGDFFKELPQTAIFGGVTVTTGDGENGTYVYTPIGNVGELQLSITSPQSYDTLIVATFTSASAGTFVQTLTPSGPDEVTGSFTIQEP